MCIVALSAVGWAGRRVAGNGMFWLQPQHACHCGQYKNFYRHDKTKALLLHLISVVASSDSWWMPLQSSPSVRSRKHQHATGKSTSPHSNRGYRDLCAQIQKWLASCSLLIRDGSLDWMCDWLSMQSVDCCYVLCIASVRNRRVDKLDYRCEMW